MKDFHRRPKLSLQTLTLGKHNSKLLELRKAIAMGQLLPGGLLPIEGFKLIEEAARSGLSLVDVFIRKGTAFPNMLIHGGPTSVYEVDAATFKGIQTTETSQGIIALVRPPEFELEMMLAAANPLIVVLAGIQDPGNAGTILRSAEAFRATACIATTGTVSVHNPKAVRASAGSIFRLPHVWGVQSEAFQQMRHAGLSVVGTSPSGRDTIETWNWKQPTAVLIGNEGSGLSETEIQLCDSILRIPHSPSVDSMNSAVAAGIVLYEASRQRKSL
jgi:TrmH family RNA methyltransferase